MPGPKFIDWHARIDTSTTPSRSKNIIKKKRKAYFFPFFLIVLEFFYFLYPFATDNRLRYIYSVYVLYLLFPSPFKSNVCCVCYPSYIGWLSQSQIISRNKNRQKLLVEREAFVYTYLIENTKKKRKRLKAYITQTGAPEQLQLKRCWPIKREKEKKLFWRVTRQRT